MSVAGGLLPVAAAVALLVFAVRLTHEPRRLGNAVWLGIALLLLGLWLLRLDWLTPVLLVVLGGVALVLPVALLVNGIRMWRREGRSTGNLLSLALGAGLIALEALFFAPLGRWGSAVVAIAAALACYFGFLFFSLLVYSVVYSRIGRRGGVDAIIVLGCGLAGDRVPPLLAGRLERAIRLYTRESTPPLLVVSGGRGPDEQVTEAEAMAAYLRERGVPADRIRREEQARTTEENLRFSAELLPAGARRVVAVTSNYHVFRAAVECRRLHLPYHATGSPTARYFLPSALLREFAALILHYRRTTIAASALIVGAGIALAVSA
ncbi:YdcF family protein [Amycolatopsis sp. OK19-0408]|uniref:YdcF family protein n=1 Tax=Amycolatopsis iheyensis TaxID=2945988 RepID=A0A9X2N8M5_9PSEU|nr:YdcF family protein [Amycolatopsis iheyensis]MCR6482586.1 YdcF family protein [Amycolatopsis iheyensis]